MTPEQHAETMRAALDEVTGYVRCLEDVQDGRSVRGLAEAKAGYDHGRDVLARLAADAERLREALTRIALGIHDDATYDVLDCALIARAALAVYPGECICDPPGWLEPRDERCPVHGRTAKPEFWNDCEPPADTEQRKVWGPERMRHDPEQP